MLSVLTLTEAFQAVEKITFPAPRWELLPLSQAVGRLLFEDVTAREYVPDFHRSTVDGFAVRGEDTFGCSDSMPALLKLQYSIEMGERPTEPLLPGCCAEIPTGGALPPEADAVVMLEYAEDFGDGTVAIYKGTPPGTNLIFRGDDVYPGKKVLENGRRLTSADIGALAAMGVTEVRVTEKPKIAIISTGDELVPVSQNPVGGQIRDVNSSVLYALCLELGGEPIAFGIVPDSKDLLGGMLHDAADQCDLVLLSGGSSVGQKDAAADIISQKGKVIFHGLALKPGKPTILGAIKDTPVLGLPGHPAAAYFVASLFLPRLISEITDEDFCEMRVDAYLSQSVSANHGREQLMPVTLSKTQRGTEAYPIRSKSGLITCLAGADGYFTVPRDCEGLEAGALVQVVLNHQSKELWL